MQKHACRSEGKEEMIQRDEREKGRGIERGRESQRGRKRERKKIKGKREGEGEREVIYKERDRERESRSTERGRDKVGKRRTLYMRRAALPTRIIQFQHMHVRALLLVAEYTPPTSVALRRSIQIIVW